MSHYIKPIKFTKMHGLGNDFVIINQEDLASSGSIPNQNEEQNKLRHSGLDPESHEILKRVQDDKSEKPHIFNHDEYNLEELARYISNRHTGIGCDQFITYKREQDYYAMTIHNPDGSSAGACGNAVRCLVKLLYEEGKLNNNLSNNIPNQNAEQDKRRHSTLEPKSHEILKQFQDDKNSKAQILIRDEYNNSLQKGDEYLATCQVKVRERYLKCAVIKDNNDILVQVNMGPVSFNEDWMPKDSDLWQLAELYGLDPKEIICVDIGNPHLIIFCNLSLKEKKFLGETLEHHKLFPNGVNVNFATVKDNRINLSVYERSTGFTFACGSGACASFAAGCRLGFIQPNLPCEVLFQLGGLKMSMQNDEVIMTGQGVLVALGELLIS